MKRYISEFWTTVYCARLKSHRIGGSAPSHRLMTCIHWCSPLHSGTPKKLCQRAKKSSASSFFFFFFFLLVSIKKMVSEEWHLGVFFSYDYSILNFIRIWLKELGHSLFTGLDFFNHTYEAVCPMYHFLDIVISLVHLNSCPHLWHIFVSRI